MKCWILALLLLLTACGTDAVPAGDPPPDVQAAPEDTAAPSLAKDETPERILCRIVESAEDGGLLLAGLEGGSADVYVLSTEGLAVALDGQPADASVLEDGMSVEISYNGFIQETFPAGFGEAYSIAAWSRGQEQNPMGTCYDLCGLYLQVLEDLWEKDSGLNEGISQIAVDLTNAPGELTESEKSAIIFRFGERHKVSAFAATFEELTERGMITAEPLEDIANNAASYQSGKAFQHWEDGCFFSITPNESHEGESYSLPTLFFDAEKWRSSLGAYYFHDCSAIWGEDTSWTYTPGAEMIA